MSREHGRFQILRVKSQVWRGLNQMVTAKVTRKTRGIRVIVANHLWKRTTYDGIRHLHSTSSHTQFTFHEK